MHLSERAPTVLICDDEPLHRRLVRDALQQNGFRILETPNDESAVELGSRPEVDAVVLDIAMPGMTGLEVLERLRLSRGAALPIVVLTARTQSYDRDATERAGATRHITKPFSPTSLAELLDELIRPAS